MYDYLSGTIVEILTDAIIIDVHGIGYRVNVANPERFQFLLKENYKVWTYYYLREDLAQIYGFYTKEERELFRLLLDVNGIGPKGALAILTYDFSAIITAIIEEDLTLLTKIPGVGKKTAQRLIIELKDKVKRNFSEKISNKDSISTNKNSSVDKFSNQLINDTLEALEALGYSAKELASLKDNLRDLQTQEDTIDSLLRKALAYLGQKVGK